MPYRKPTTKVGLCYECKWSDLTASGVVKAATGAEGPVVKKAGQKFEAALATIRPWVAAMKQQLFDLAADEVEWTFGVKVVGEAGNLAIGKVGGEANYEVTLKWICHADD